MYVSRRQSSLQSAPPLSKYQVSHIANRFGTFSHIGWSIEKVVIVQNIDCEFWGKYPYPFWGYPELKNVVFRVLSSPTQASKPMDPFWPESHKICIFGKLWAKSYFENQPLFTILVQKNKTKTVFFTTNPTRRFIFVYVEMTHFQNNLPFTCFYIKNTVFMINITMKFDDEEECWSWRLACCGRRDSRHFQTSWVWWRSRRRNCRPDSPEANPWHVLGSWVRSVTLAVSLHLVPRGRWGMSRSRVKGW